MISEKTETDVRDDTAARTAPREAPKELPAAPVPKQLPPWEPERRKSRWWLWLLAIVGVLSVAWYLHAHRAAKATAAAGAAGGKGKQDHPQPVLVATAKTKDVGVYLTGLGSVVPLNTVNVKSRVDGQLLRIDFTEGQVVRAGDLLAELDPRPFQVQLMQAEGQKGKDEAALNNARIDLQRYQVLFKQDSIAKQQLDTQVATVEQDEAVLKSDQSQIESAKLNLVYSRITAPSGGRVGLRETDVGNIVHAADTNGIVVITQLQPIDVVFTIPADQLPQVLGKVHAGQVLAVDAFDRDLKHELASGKILALDNQIDPTTGTVRIKAVFPNENEALFPSQFVNARLLVDVLHNATTVPSAAIQRSPQSTYVYVVKPDHTVESRNVAVQQTEGDEATLRSGVAPGETVVIDGVDKLRPGIKVDPQTVGANGQPVQSPKAQGQKGQKAGGGRRKASS
jgi:membrane fusion protein, multidrug efflux system